MRVKFVGARAGVPLSKRSARYLKGSRHLYKGLKKAAPATAWVHANTVLELRFVLRIVEVQEAPSDG